MHLTVAVIYSFTLLKLAEAVISLCYCIFDFGNVDSS